MFCTKKFQCTDNDDCPKHHKCVWGICYKSGNEDDPSCQSKSSSRLGIVTPQTIPGEPPLWNE